MARIAESHAAALAARAAWLESSGMAPNVVRLNMLRLLKSIRPLAKVGVAENIER
jgi:hypothetical protein